MAKDISCNTFLIANELETTVTVQQYDWLSYNYKFLHSFTIKYVVILTND